MNATFMFVLLCIAQPDEDAAVCPNSLEIVKQHLLLRDCRALQKPILDQNDGVRFPACVREVGDDARMNRPTTEPH